MTELRRWRSRAKAHTCVFLLGFAGCSAATPDDRTNVQTAALGVEQPMPVATAGELAVAGRGFELDLYAANASSVVLTRVDSVGSYEAVYPSGDELIASIAELTVEETLVGEAGESIEVAFLGGTVGDVTMSAGHGLSMEEGETAVLFLTHGPTQTRVLGGGAGKLLVEDGIVLPTGETIAALAEALAPYAQARNGGGSGEGSGEGGAR